MDKKRELAELFKATAAQGLEGEVAFKAFCAAITIPILQKIDLESIMRQLFAVERLGPGAQAIYPIADEYTSPVWVLPGLGYAAQNFMEGVGEELVVPIITLDASADWKVDFAIDGRVDIARRAADTVAKSIIDREERSGWEVILPAVTTDWTPPDGSILTARSAPIYEVPAASVGAGYLSKELVNRMMVGFKRVDRTLTDLYISPEDAADIREWTDTDIDPVTRREIFQASGMGSIWNVQLHELRHFGAQGLYNINDSTSGYGIFLADAADEFNDYTLDNPNIVDANGEVTTLGETQILGFDLSVNDSLVMPIKKEYEAVDDPTLLRDQKQGFFGWQKYGMACLDPRMIGMGIIDRSI